MDFPEHVITQIGVLLPMSDFIHLTWSSKKFDGSLWRARLIDDFKIEPKDIIVDEEYTWHQLYQYIYQSHLNKKKKELLRWKGDGYDVDLESNSLIKIDKEINRVRLIRKAEHRSSQGLDYLKILNRMLSEYGLTPISEYPTQLAQIYLQIGQTIKKILHVIESKEEISPFEQEFLNIFSPISHEIILFSVVDDHFWLGSNQIVTIFMDCLGRFNRIYTQEHCAIL